MAPLDLQLIQGKPQEFLNIDPKSQEINGVIHIANYVDKDTKLHISYVSSLQLSGYGETKEKSMELLRASIENYFQFILSLSSPYDELSGLGWKKSWYKNKEYSKSYIDVTGELKDFAVPNTIQLETLTL